MCAQNNMTVARPSTPASYFHLLRKHAYSRPRRPLVVFTPKSMLRLRGATSSVEDFTSGAFEPVLDDYATDAAQVQRVLLVAGKIYYDLKSELEKRGENRIAILRLEQFYPFPEQELTVAMQRYGNAQEIFWVQDEPENQGAWPFLAPRLAKLSASAGVQVVSRAASAATSTGSAKVHALQQEELIQRATTL